MRVVAINEAEAIIEPFWDGGSSEHPGDKYSLLDAYRITPAPGAQAGVRQWWCAVVVEIDRCEPGATALAMETDCDLSLGGYDVFRVFASLPGWVRMTVRGRIDGQEQVLLDRVAGTDSTDEFDGPCAGRRLTSLRVEFALAEPRPASILLLWFGLANRAAQARLEARVSPYTADWPGALLAEALPPRPEIGILFDEEDLAGLREKLRAGPLQAAFARLRDQARQDMALNPEAEISRYIAKPDRRWCRTRDMARTCTAGVMERLAFVGLVDGDREMSVMAARMALSAAHCEYWCESILGVFPGASWHHRSFTEEIYCRACALVLDWAGFCLTPHGKQIVRDAIIMKGLPRIESDFKRMEYIRHMNQGIVFSSGRIFGLLSLLPAYPRYRGLVDEAERDLHEMIDSYVQADGGTLEGMGYWNFTFSTAMPLLYALARYHGRAFEAYVPPAVVKTADYALSMLSTAGDSTRYLPVNDAHAGRAIAPGLVAAYARIDPRPAWQSLYAAMLHHEDEEPDLYHLIVAPAAAGAAAPIVAPGFHCLPETGQVSSIRLDPQAGYVHFHFCSGPAHTGHSHEDKGSFILEAGGEVLAADRGVTSYEHPETGLIKIAARHNLLYPEHPQGALFHQPVNAQGGRLASAVERDGRFCLVSDNAAAWEAGLFATNLRRVFSPEAGLYLIDDEVAMDRPLAVSFRVNSPCPIRQAGAEYWVQGQRVRLRIVPLNWRPDAVTIGPEGIDGDLRPVTLLRLATGPAPSHRLLTALQVVPAEGGELWLFAANGGIIEARRGEDFLAVTPAGKPALVVHVRDGGVLTCAARCDGDCWHLENRL